MGNIIESILEFFGDDYPLHRFDETVGYYKVIWKPTQGKSLLKECNNYVKKKYSVSLDVLIDERGGEFRLMTFNFPKKEYNKKSKFHKWLKKHLDANALNVKIVGGKEIEAIEGVNELIKSGAEVRCVDEAPTHHINLLEVPNYLSIVWDEPYHAKERPLLACFVYKPIENFWRAANEHYRELFERGEDVERILHERYGKPS